MAHKHQGNANDADKNKIRTLTFFVSMAIFKYMPIRIFSNADCIAMVH